jgi:2',3'-cyclic-nucleotide 2'-phosphodiesterase/3'-nucleotidase
MFQHSLGSKCAAIALSALMAASAATAALTPAAYAAEEQTKTLQILGTSDLHGRFDSFDYASGKPNTNGGLTQLSTKIQELRKQNKDTLVVDAGDSVQDNMADLFLKDTEHPMFVAMDAIGYDSWTLGNHEFNYGSAMIEKLVKEPKCAVLCGNVYKKDGTRLGKPYIIKTVDGVRVAIIGMTTPNILRWDGSKLPGYKVTSPVEETRKAIDEIKASKAADVFVGVMHMGLDNEYGTDDSTTAVAQACPELAAIVSGHAHLNVPEKKVGSTVLTEPGKYGEALSQVQLTVKGSEGNYTVADASSTTISLKGTPADASLDTILKPYHDRAVAYGKQAIGKLTGGDLVPQTDVQGITQAQVQDTALMHLILDTQMYYTRKYVPAGAHFVTSAAMLDASSNIKQGNIKRSDMVNIYKFDNTLCTMKITGKQLRKYMEWSASYYNTYKQGDLTVSFNPTMPSYLYDTFAGVNYNINISKQAGSRVENLCYPDGTAVKDADTIYLTSNDYRTSSKLTGDLFKDDNVTVIHKTADDQLGAVRDMIAQYISSVKKGTISNSFTANWKLTGTNFNLEKRALAANLVNSGKLSIPQVDNGKNYNAKSLTEKDVESFLAQEPKLVCKDASGKALDAGSIVSIKKNNVLTFTVEFPVSVNYSVGNGSVAQTGTVHPLAGSQTVYTVRAVGKSGQQVGVYLDGRKVFAVQVAA